MYIYLKILVILLFTSLLVSCKNTKLKQTQVVYKEYGLLNNQHTNGSVILKLKQFNNWSELVKRIEDVVCHDSLPKVTFKTADTIKTVYLQNFCNEKNTCIFIKQRNVIEIDNDIIYKSKKTYPFDSLKSVLRKDVFNKGKKPSWSETPDKLLIYISYDASKSIKKLTKTLDKLTDIYEEISTRKALNVLLVQKLKIPPPPKNELRN